MTNNKRVFRKYIFITISVLTVLFSSCSLSNKKTSKENQLQNKARQIDSLVSLYNDYKGFNGAVLVAHEGEIIYKKGFGLANIEWDIPNQTDTKFRIASVTKSFTAMLIMQLVAKNKLDLNEPIISYLPDYPKVNGDQITIHHLLSHTSGIPNNYNSDNKINQYPDRNRPDQLVSKFSGLPLEFKPGKRFAYSNSGYVVLGYLIEQITGKSYESVLQEQILSPLGMKNTGVDKHRPITKNRATGYFKILGDYVNSDYVDMSSVYSAGAIYSTVEDMYLWDKALYTEKLIPKKYMDMIFNKQISDPDYGGYYGYGWEIIEKSIGNTSETIETMGHSGSLNGYCALFTRIPSSKTSIIFLNNTRRAFLNAMTTAITGILNDKPYDFPKKSVAYSLFKIIDKEGTAKGIQFYEEFKNKKNYYLSENEMNEVSYKLLQSNRSKEAVDVLKMGISSFPNAFNLYDSHGEVLLVLGDTLAAIKEYKKSIELNPDNKNGVRILKKLGEDRFKQKKEVDFLLETQDSWTKETFNFPLHFAPDINFQGKEYAVFPSGWRKEKSNEFWSYVFAWYINLNKEITEQELTDYIQIYFDGLMNGVNKDKNLIVPKTIAQFYKKEDPNQVLTFIGKITLYDAFATKKQMTLNVRVEQNICQEKGKSIIVFRFSPKKFENKVWDLLDKVNLKKTSCE